MISPVNPAKLPPSPWRRRSPWPAHLALASALVLLSALAALSLRDGCANPSFASYAGVNDCPATK